MRSLEMLESQVVVHPSSCSRNVVGAAAAAVPVDSVLTLASKHLGNAVLRMVDVGVRLLPASCCLERASSAKASIDLDLDQTTVEWSLIGNRTDCCRCLEVATYHRCQMVCRAG